MSKESCLCEDPALDAGDVGRIDLHFVRNDTLCSHLTVPVTSFPVLCFLKPWFRSWGQRSLQSSSTEGVDFSATTDRFKNLQAVHSRLIVEHDEICRSTRLQSSIIVGGALDMSRVPRTKWN